MRRSALLAVLPVLLLAACGKSDDQAAAGPTGQRVIVAFTLNDVETELHGCHGDGGYSDIDNGTPVVLRNGSGDTLGADELGTGVNAGAGNCTWLVTFEDVPADEDFYATEVGGRGEITKSAADLADAEWRFSVSLGD